MIQKYDSERKKNEKLSDIDRMAQEEAEYLLKKANELRLEEEDEVKHLNEVRNLLLFLYHIKIILYKNKQLNNFACLHEKE